MTGVPGSADGPLSIEDYALVGDCQTAALVGRNGSIDWLCWPHFDSAACFAALLGLPDHGRWLLAPADAGARSTRGYRGDTMVLETNFETDSGSVAVIDLMLAGKDVPSGWRAFARCRVGKLRPRRCSSACSPCAMMWAAGRGVRPGVQTAGR